MNQSISPKTFRAPTALRPALRELGLLGVGGAAYYSLEVLCRGYSHWSMALCGGVCLSGIFHINRAMKSKPILLRATISGILITAVELVCGCLVNLTFRLGVWDYSHLPLNLLGQICIPFTLLWIALSIPVCGICSLCERKNVKKKTKNNT
ncbi:MAG: hypothetical protein J6Q82_00710 [Clostridia bacterium]|nr:hypothetical protein [Clostridia bacterium]